FLLERGTKVRLEIGERLRDAVTDCARLARQTAARNRNDDIVLRGAVRDHERLLKKHPKDRTGEIDVKLAVVDGDLAGAWLDPDTCDSVLPLTGRIGSAVRVQLLDVAGGFL